MNALLARRAARTTTISSSNPPIRGRQSQRADAITRDPSLPHRPARADPRMRIVNDSDDPSRSWAKSYVIRTRTRKIQPVSRSTIGPHSYIHINDSRRCRACRYGGTHWVSASGWECTPDRLLRWRRVPTPVLRSAHSSITPMDDPAYTWNWKTGEIHVHPRVPARQRKRISHPLDLDRRKSCNTSQSSRQINK
jgi:hypothetical protein